MSSTGPGDRPATGPQQGPPRRPSPVPRLRMLAVGKFFGVPIYFAPSWLIIAGLLTVYYGPVVRHSVRGVSASSAYLIALAYAALFALCVLAHELGHTAVALALRKPVKQIVIFLLGGVSEIEKEPDRPRDEFLISIAGPLVSAALSVGLLFGFLAAPDHSMGAVLLLLLFWSNVIVVGFNLLPGLPLDGGRVLRAAVWAVSRSQLTGTRVGAGAGRAVAIGVVLLSPLVGRGSSGVFSSVICVALALYLWFGASQSLRIGVIMDRLPQIDMEKLLRPGLLVPADLSIDAALRRMWQGSARGLVLVDSSERPSAIVDEARVNAVAPEQRPWVQLQSVARPLEEGLVLPRGLTGQQIMDALRRTPASEYLVVDEQGAPAGILARADFAAALNPVKHA